MKNIQRKQSLQGGTVDPNGITTVYADSPGGMRKMKCTCGGTAIPTLNPAGKPVSVCGSCGAQYRSSPL